MTKSLVLLVALMVMTLTSSSQAFPVAAYATMRRSPGRMSTSFFRRPADISDDNTTPTIMGATERLLLEAKQKRENGLRQEYGVTIKKDGWDGVRAAIWLLFDATEIIFPMLALALTAGLLLNLMGYGYYFDQGSFVVDTLEHIRQEQLFQLEATKMTVDETIKHILL